MVTIQEAAKQIESRQTQLEERRETLEGARTQAQQFQTQRPVSQMELRRQRLSRQDNAKSALQLRAERQEEIQQKTKIKSEALETISFEFEKQRELEKEISDISSQFEAQKKAIEQQQKVFEAQQAERAGIESDIAIASKLVGEGRSFAGETARVKEFARQIQAQGEFETQQRAFKEAGLEAITEVGGVPTIIGFKDIETGQIIQIEDLGEIAKPRLDILEERGIIKFEEVVTDIKAETLPSVITEVKIKDDIIVSEKVFPQGKETFIAAVDVGGGRMQDFRFISEGGKLIVSEPTGVSGQQSTRFKESGRVGKSAREIALSRVGVEVKDDGFFTSIGSRITGFVKDVVGGKEGREAFIGASLPTISAFQPIISEIEPPPSPTIIGRLRGISKEQASLIGAEGVLGIGGVGSVGGKEVTRKITDITLFPETRIKVTEPFFGTAQAEIRDGQLRQITGIETDIDIPELKIGDIISAPAETSMVLSRTGGQIGSFGVGAFFGAKGLRKETDIARPSFKTTIQEPQFGTQQFEPSGDPLTFFKDVEVEVPAVTVGERKEFGRKVGGIATMGGLFLTPVVGATVFASQVEREVREAGGIAPFIKEKPLEAAFIGGIVATAGGLKLFRTLKSPRVIKEGEDILRLTTRGEDFFGARIRVSKKGFEFIPSQKGVIIKREVIPKAKLDIEAAETVGIDILKVSKEKTKEIVFFPRQKLSQVSVEGSKVIITKDGKIIFEGNPFTIKGKKQREEVFELLEKRGFSKKDIQELIRLRQPVTIEQTIGGVIQVKRKGALGQFQALQIRPAVQLGAGLRTRGAKPIKTDITFERRIIKIDGKDFVLEQKGTQTFLRRAERGGVRIREERELSGGLIVGKARPEFSIPVEVSKTGKIKVLKESPAQIITSISTEVPTLPIKAELRIDSSQTLLLKKAIKESEDIGKIVAGRKSSQEFFEQLYFPQELKAAPKIAPPKIAKVPKTTLEVPEAKELPSMVTPFVALAAKQKAVPITTLDTSIKTKTIQEPQLKTIQEPQLKTEDLLKTIQEPQLKTIQEPQLKVIQEPQIRTIPLVKIAQQIKQAQRAVITPKVKPRFEQPPKTPPKEPPVIKIPIPPKTSLAKRLAKKVEEDGFEAFGFRFGEQISLGEAETQKVAETTLSKFLKGTLGA